MIPQSHLVKYFELEMFLTYVWDFFCSFEKKFMGVCSIICQRFVFVFLHIFMMCDDGNKTQVTRRKRESHLPAHLRARTLERNLCLGSWRTRPWPKSLSWRRKWARRNQCSRVEVLSWRRMTLVTALPPLMKMKIQQLLQNLLLRLSLGVHQNQ